MGFEDDALDSDAEHEKKVSEIIEERKIISQFFNEIARNTCKFCYGIENIMDCLEDGNIEKLIIYEELELKRLKIIKKKDKNKGEDKRDKRDNLKIGKEKTDQEVIMVQTWLLYSLVEIIIELKFANGKNIGFCRLDPDSSQQPVLVLRRQSLSVLSILTFSCLDKASCWWPFPG